MAKEIEKFIRDNVHGDIYIDDEVVMDLIGTREFQRLRRIIQLGGGQYVFPSANHSRFSHCIGVYHIICKFVENKSIHEHMTQNEILVAKVAGLLHDIGHGPYSHTFEKISTQSHEQYTIDMIIGDTEVNSVLKSHGLDPKEVASVIEGKHPNNIVNLMVSSQLDADRLDYLARDSKGAGVNYSSLDINWIVRNGRIVDGKLAFPIKTIYAIEAYLLGRYHMYKQVYNHKVSEEFDNTFVLWFKRLKYLYDNNFEFKNKKLTEMFLEVFEGKVIPMEKYIMLDDYAMSFILQMCTEETDGILVDLSLRILNRNFLTITDVDDVEEVKKTLIKNGFDLEYYFKEIKSKQFNIYLGFKGQKDEHIYIIDKDDNLKTIIEVSKILDEKPESDKNKKYYIFPKVNVE